MSNVELTGGHPGVRCGQGGNGALERTRTSDLQVRNLLLYPLSYERTRFERIPQPSVRYSSQTP